MSRSSALTPPQTNTVLPLLVSSGPSPPGEGKYSIKQGWTICLKLLYKQIEFLYLDHLQWQAYPRRASRSREGLLPPRKRVVGGEVERIACDRHFSKSFFLWKNTCPAPPVNWESPVKIMSMQNHTHVDNYYLKHPPVDNAEQQTKLYLPASSRPRRCQPPWQPLMSWRLWLAMIRMTSAMTMTMMMLMMMATCSISSKNNRKLTACVWVVSIHLRMIQRLILKI